MMMSVNLFSEVSDFGTTLNGPPMRHDSEMVADTKCMVEVVRHINARYAGFGTGVSARAYDLQARG